MWGASRLGWGTDGNGELGSWMSQGGRARVLVTCRAAGGGGRSMAVDEGMQAASGGQAMGSTRG